MLPQINLDFSEAKQDLIQSAPEGAFFDNRLEKEGFLELMRKYHTLLAEAHSTKEVKLWEFPSPTEARDFRRPINTPSNIDTSVFP